MKTIFPRLILLFVLLVPPRPAEAVQETVDITIPAVALEQVIREALPLSLDTGSPQVEGTLTIDRLDRLELHNNLLSVQGVITGHNLVMNTRIGGQEIRLKLGNLSMPVSGDFVLRFDRQKKTLFIQPRFAPRAGSKKGGKSTTSLAPILAVLEDREYPLVLERFGPFLTMFSGQKRALTLQTADLEFGDHAVVVKLRPTVRKTD